MDNTTRELPQTAVIYVGKDRDYRTVQEAVDAIPEDNTTPVMLKLDPGVYTEAVRIPGTKPYITLIGTGDKAEDTVISYDNYAGRKRENGDMTGTFRSATVSIYANDCGACNLTFRNSYDGVSGAEGGRQALALYASGERLVFTNCRFLGKQDTLYVRDGSQLYEKCYIEGDVDFIFGAARTVFESCEIRSLVHSRREPGAVQGYVAARVRIWRRNSDLFSVTAGSFLIARSRPFIWVGRGTRALILLPSEARIISNASSARIFIRTDGRIWAGSWGGTRDSANTGASGPALRFRQNVPC